jgi:hypothetical protein
MHANQPLKTILRNPKFMSPLLPKIVFEEKYGIYSSDSINPVSVKDVLALNMIIPLDAEKYFGLLNIEQHDVCNLADTINSSIIVLEEIRNQNKGSIYSKIKIG